MSQPLYTIGYSGHTCASFVELLRKHKIEWLLDVRAKPISRKGDFSRKALPKIEGFKYLWLPSLGVPEALRRSLKSGQIKLTEYLALYDDHLKRQQRLAHLHDLLRNGRCCLMCLESDPRTCHRSVIAQRAADLLGYRVLHIY